MRIILCVLLAASVASAQTVRGNTISNIRPSVGSPAPVPDATLAANPSPAPSVAPATAAAPAGAAPASTAGAAGGRAAAAPGGGLGPAFFGPGLNNPLAFAPNQFLVSRAQQVAAANPNVRVFVDIDGTIEFTDQFGREVEIVDQFGFDALEPIDPREQQQLLLQSRQNDFQLRRQQLEQQLLTEFGLAPGGQAFAAGGQAFGAGGQAGAQPVGQNNQGFQRQFRIAV